MTQEATQITTTPPLPGLQLVQDLNKALQTLATDFAGSSDPAALAWPYATWADTGTGTVKRRNAANSAWVIEGRLFRAHLPIIPLADIPTTDIGQISVVTKGTMEWDGTAYAPVIAEAENVSYDKTSSGLAAEDVQAAIDETLGVAQTFTANDPRVKTATNATGDAPIYACRAWVNFNGTGVVTIRASGNVSSVTDNGTGRYTVNFANPMPDANYSVGLGSVGYTPTNYSTNLFIETSATGTFPELKTTTQLSVIYGTSTAPVGNYDCGEVNVTIHR